MLKFLIPGCDSIQKDSLPMRSAHRHSALVVVVVLLFIPAAMAVTPASSTTYTITVQEDGSALWQIEYRTLLTTEADLAAFAPSVLDLPHAEAVHRLEMLIRAYDPCISCATHFLDLRIVEDGAEEGTI